MEYLQIFIAGITTFITPCMLPMVPIYLAYFAGENSKDKKTLYRNTLAFILGFTIVFVALGVFASFLNTYILKYRKYINIVFGIFLILNGLNFMGIFKSKVLNKEVKIDKEIKKFNIFGSMLFGILFALGWSPCLGPLLTVALEKAATSEYVLEGAFMLFTYSLGIGVPFFLSSIFMAEFKDAFNKIKNNYDIIMRVIGILLVIYGILKMFSIV